MRFDRKSPCDGCPFRTDQPGYLHPERAREIGETLLDDDHEWFGCHKSTRPNDEGERECVESTQQCAGSLRFAMANNQINIATRFAIMIGHFDPEKLDQAIPVAQTLEELVEHHRRAWNRSP